MSDSMCKTLFRIIFFIHKSETARHKISNDAGKKKRYSGNFKKKIGRRDRKITNV